MDRQPYTEEELEQLLTLLSTHRLYLDGRTAVVTIGARDAYNVQRVGIETERDGIELGFPVKYGEEQ